MHTHQRQVWWVHYFCGMSSGGRAAADGSGHSGPHRAAQAAAGSIAGQYLGRSGGPTLSVSFSVWSCGCELYPLPEPSFCLLLQSCYQFYDVVSSGCSVNDLHLPLPKREGGNVRCLPPVESQGCHLIPLFYLLLFLLFLCSPAAVSVLFFMERRRKNVSLFSIFFTSIFPSTGIDRSDEMISGTSMSCMVWQGQYEGNQLFQSFCLMVVYHMCDLYICLWVDFVDFCQRGFMRRVLECAFACDIIVLSWGDPVLFKVQLLAPSYFSFFLHPV